MESPTTNHHPSSAGMPGIRLRARNCMADRGIRSVSELRRRLHQAGVEISHQQLSRHVDNKSEHLSVPLIKGLLQVFHCRVDELITAA